MRLEPKARRQYCSGCGRGVSAVHDWGEQRVRDQPVFEVPVVLIIPRLRLACRRCGPKRERQPALTQLATVLALARL
ncbi:transposase family protein [Cupriavidus sp. 8B]